MALYQGSGFKKEDGLNCYLEHVVCNICGSQDYEVLFRSTLNEDDFRQSLAQYSISQKSPGCGQIVRCKHCGLAYVNPREKHCDMIDNYAMVKDEEYLKESKSRDITFLRGLRFLERYCPQKGNLLDVGCFVGLFLRLARDHGWSVQGIEPSRWAVQYAKEELNLNVSQGALEDIRLEDGYFNAATMWDVIEHLPDPQSTLSLLHRKLKKDGVLLLNTFNYDSIFRKMCGRKYWFIERMHIYYFSPQTLAKMLMACNYEVLKIIPHFKTLSLGYYVARLKDVSGVLTSLMKPVSSLFGLSKRNITAYAGQMTVIARKKQ